MEKVRDQLGGGGRRGAAAPTGLQKQNSWSPDIERDEAWERRRGLHRRGSALRRGRSVTDDDLDELRGCIDLGFEFEAAGCAVCGAGRSRLVQTLPALDLYYAVHGGGGRGVEACASPCACGSSSEASEESPLGEPHVHTLSRRHAGDGEDEAEAVGAGGGVVRAQPFLIARLRDIDVVSTLHREERRRDEEEKERIPGRLRRAGRKNDEEGYFVSGGPPPSTLARLSWTD